MTNRLIQFAVREESTIWKWVNTVAPPFNVTIYNSKDKDKMSRDMTKPTNWLCAQQKLRSAGWASAKFDQSLRCPHEESLATHWAQAKTLIRLGGCPGWSESSLGAQPFCWFCHVVAQIYSGYKIIHMYIVITFDIKKSQHFSLRKLSIFTVKYMLQIKAYNQAI